MQSKSHYLNVRNCVTTHSYKHLSCWVELQFTKKEDDRSLEELPIIYWLLPEQTTYSPKGSLQPLYVRAVLLQSYSIQQV